MLLLLFLTLFFLLLLLLYSVYDVVIFAVAVATIVPSFAVAVVVHAVTNVALFAVTVVEIPVIPIRSYLSLARFSYNKLVCSNLLTRMVHVSSQHLGQKAKQKFVLLEDQIGLVI